MPRREGESAGRSVERYLSHRNEGEEAMPQKCRAIRVRKRFDLETGEGLRVAGHLVVIEYAGWHARLSIAGPLLNDFFDGPVIGQVIRVGDATVEVAGLSGNQITLAVRSPTVVRRIG